MGKQNSNQLMLNAESTTKRRKLNNDYNVQVHTKMEQHSNISLRVKMEKNVKKEKKLNKKKKHRKKTKRQAHSDDEDETVFNPYLQLSYSADSFVGIRTKDGEVRVKIPGGTMEGDSMKTDRPKVQFTVFGNACSDRIE